MFGRPGRRNDTKGITVSGRGSRLVTVTLPRTLHTRLARRRRASVRLGALVRDPADRARTVTRTVVIRTTR